jgi:hypothetical protein
MGYLCEEYMTWSSQSFGIKPELHSASSGPTGRFHADKAEAIKFARRMAQFENREGKTAVVYSFNTDRNQMVEWSA